MHCIMNTYTENRRAQNRNAYVQLLNTSISRIATAGCLVLEIRYRVTADVYLQLTKLIICKRVYGIFPEYMFSRRQNRT